VPAPPTRAPLRERYDRRRQGVIDTAAQVFAQRGYHATSMNDLVEATNLAAGGLYHYIGNKEKLLASILDQMLKPLVEEVAAIVDSDEAAEAQLQAVLRAWVANAERYRYHVIVFQQEWRTVANGPEFEEARAAHKRLEGMLRDLINRIHDETGKPRNPQIVRMALLAMLNYTPQWFDPEGPFTSQEVADAYCELVLGRPPSRKPAATRRRAGGRASSSPA
jgi:TetR/AcrR family transcriptional regulator, cholesterol catabolism regulator